MQYPTLDQVEKADRLTICKWWRYLPTATSDQQRTILRRVCDRFEELGGFTATISKAIGFTPQLN